MFGELLRLRMTRVAPPLYTRLVHSIPWETTPIPSPTMGQWLAPKDNDGSIRTVYHIQKLDLVEQHRLLLVAQLHEVQIARCGGQKRMVIDYKPREDNEPDFTLWLWEDEWICSLEWDPKEWLWRRIGILAETTVLNYSTKQGYQVALHQNNNLMGMDAEQEAAGYNSKARAKFFSRTWHPYLSRDISAMPWLILIESLLVGAWRERINLQNACQLYPIQSKEALQHTF